MTTLTGFTRPADPIVEIGLEAKILADTGFVVTTILNPTTVDVTGSTITSANTSVLQTSISSYIYTNPIGDSTKINVTAMDNNVPMGGGATNVVTSYSALTNDTAVYNSTRNRAYINGTLTYDVIAWLDSATTNSSGVATFWLTDNHLSTGNAIYSTVYSFGINSSPYGSSPYQQVVPTISSDKKSITVTVNQVTVVLGLISTTSAASGVTITLNVMGK